MKNRDYEEQDELVENIVSNIYGFKLYEAPTGFGKTHVLLKAASKLVKLYGKKVIISTINNNLVRDMYSVSQKFKFEIDERSFSIVVGKSNYIDPTKLNHLVSSEEIFTFISKESYQNWLASPKREGVLFFDELDELADYIDPARSKEFQSAIVYDVKPEGVADFNTQNVSITNHFYLLYRAAIVKNLNLSDYFILMDEVHDIAGIAESVFDANFSPFNLKNLSSRLLKEIDHTDEDWKGKQSLNAALKGCIIKMDSIVREGVKSAEKHIGEYLIEGNLFDRLTKNIVDYHQSNKHVEFSAILNKSTIIFEKNALRFQAQKGLAYAIKKEITELSSIARVHGNINKNKNIGLFLSPSKGYPTFKASKDDPLKVLHFNFWEKLEGFAGLSATLLVDTKTSEKGHAYAYRRIGINNNKTSPIKQYERVFDKHKVKIFMPQSSYISPVSIDSDHEEQEKWVTFAAHYIKTHSNKKNSMVLCGGYAEAKLLSKAVAALLPEVNIIHSVPYIQTSQTVRRFEQEGGILFATRNYATGLSLSGEKLERLFILRFPYPVFTSKVWLDLKQRQPEYFWGKYNNEMLISLRQAMGRLQRTATDTGEIHLLDSRVFSKKGGRKKYTNPELKRRIWHFAGQYGVLSKESDTELAIPNSTTLVTLSKKVEKRSETDSMDWLI